MRKVLILLLPVLLLFSAGRTALAASAEEAAYTNPDTGYAVFLSDREDLLTPEQEAALLEDMKPVTAYGGAAFVTAKNDNVSSSSYAKTEYQQYFGSGSGSLLLIDVGKRNIWIHSNGAVYRTVTKSYAASITYNAYAYAADGDYYTCAAEVFRQELTLLEGGRIARPMKIVSNVLLAVTLAMMIVYFYISKRYEQHTTTRKIKAAVPVSVMSAAAFSSVINNTQKKMIKQVKTDISSSSGSGSGRSGGGFSGGGFSGGHSSGSSGSHRF